MSKTRKTDLKNYSLTDIFNLNDLQVLQDAFAMANGIASTIVDVKGQAITRPSNHSKVCTLIRQTKKGLENCKLSGRTLGLMSLVKNKPCYFKCQSVGFIDASAPIIIGGVHMANWLIGQNWIGDVDENRIIAYAREIGAEEDEMLKAFREMNFITEIEFKEKLEFLWLFAKQISALSYQNLKFKNMVDLLKKSRRKLKNYKDNLEFVVKQRTIELTQALEEIKIVSIKDGLTGSYNRGFINENLPKELIRSKRYETPISILLCDIDHFKKVNDTFGHQCGDYVLKELVSCLEGCLRLNVDWIARYGGEEFLIVLPCTDIKSAAGIAERLRKKISELPLEYNNESLKLTASFGVSGVDLWSSREDISSEILLNSTDVYLYRAKKDGRNCIVFGPVSLESSDNRNAQLSEHLPDVI